MFSMLSNILGEEFHSSWGYSQEHLLSQLEGTGSSTYFIGQRFWLTWLFRTTEFLIDGSTLSLTVSDDQKNVQVSSCNYTSTRDVIGTLRWQAILTRIPIVLLCSRHTRYLCLHYKSLKNFSLLIVAYLLKSVYCLTPSLFHESEKGYPLGNNVKDMSLVTLGYFSR